ncbi:DUF1048 domain-containing protein [Abyssisolibacter fermentans]|uniref:DUF1048 domain-containing protein n=1 Tax=Abyssisolibacter fermentans TaxID=1766203 RepID=UPI00082C771B|nr:DUF1048 domain-containing protein [Abyssisolibacter fermentans]
MNNNSRNKIFITIGFTILLVVQMLIFLSAKGLESASLLVMFIAIIFLAVIAIMISVSELNQTKGRVKNLPEEYKKVYLDANEIITMSTMTKGQKRDTMVMVLEIFEHAAIEKRDVNEVIRNDLRGYLDEFIEVSGGRTTSLYLVGYSTFSFVAYLFAMKLYLLSRNSEWSLEGLKANTFDLGIIVVYGAIAYVFMPLNLIIMQKAANEQWVGIKRGLILIPFAIPIGLIATMMLIRDPNMLAIIEMKVPIFTSVISIFIGVVVLFGSFILMKIARKHKWHK